MSSFDTMKAYLNTFDPKVTVMRGKNDGDDYNYLFASDGQYQITISENICTKRVSVGVSATNVSMVFKGLEWDEAFKRLRVAQLVVKEVT